MKKTLHIFNNLKNNDVLKNLSKLMSGTLLSQVILFLTIPLITRLYTPEEYAIQGLFTSIIGIGAVLLTLNYHQAISITTKNFQIIYLLKISLILSFAICTVLTVFILFYSAEINNYYEIKNGYFFFLLPLGSFLLSVVLTFELIAYKINMFGLQAKSQVTFSLLSQTLKIGFGYLYPNGLTLVLSIIISYFIKFLILLSATKKNPNLRKSFLMKSKIKNYEMILNRYSSFPKYRLPQTLVTMTSLFLPLFILARYYDLTESGYYSLAIGVMGIPLTLVGSSITNVLFPKITILYSQSYAALYLYVKKCLIAIVLTIFFPFLFGSFFLTGIFSFVFGNIWENAGTYASILCLQYFFIIVIRPIVVSITVLNKNRFYFYFEIFSSMLKLLPIFISVYLQLDAKSFIFYYVLVSSLSSCFLIVCFFIFSYTKLNNFTLPRNKI